MPSATALAMPPASPGAAGWDGLARELDLWGAAGRVATLWWRDDDAVAATPALDRLLAPALPLTLAVIPAAAEPGLAERLRTAPAVTVAQHGWSHADHAPPGAKSIELGGRPAAAVAADLAAGRDRLAALFGERFRPVLVPPWNRIDPAVLPLLPGLGYAGLSTFTPRRAAEAAPRVVRVNSHVDVIAWRAGRGFVGEEAALAALTDHLAARREGLVDDEPTGLLTHHLVHDALCWAFVERLAAATRDHPAARWLGTAEAFAPSVEPA